MSRTKKLGDLLVESGKITNSQLNNGLDKQRMTGKRLGEVLIEEGIVTEDDILDVLEIQLGYKRINLENTTIDDYAIQKVPEGLARKYGLIPISVIGETIRVAISDPFNLLAIDDLKIATGMRVELLLETEEAIKDAIEKKYTAQYAEKVAKDLASQEKEAKKEFEDITSEDDGTKDAPVVKLVDSIISTAIRLKASDIHIEPYEKYVRVRNRMDGELVKSLDIPKESQNTLITRIKILANLNIAEKRIPQDGRILTTVDGKDVDLRVSVLPTITGEKVVIRILSRSSNISTKENLGILPDDLKILDRIMQKPFGIILVTGPTGSGKSTTLYSILKEFNTVDKNIITVEDPVEYAMEGINQVNVNVKAGMTFASGLRSILRQDPDIIMIGEIRDGETAEIAIRAAITGHVVLSTLHTNDAPSTIARLADMGVEPYLVATSVNGVIAQRLVRRVCKNCDTTYEASDYEKGILGVDNNEKLLLHKGKGCPACNFSGYKGRIGIYEIMEIDREIRDAVTKGENSDVVKDLAIAKGMKTLKDACIERVKMGTTTIDELIKVAYLKE